jgi:hypothetical protein
MYRDEQRQGWWHRRGTNVTHASLDELSDRGDPGLALEIYQSMLTSRRTGLPIDIKIEAENLGGFSVGCFTHVFEDNSALAAWFLPECHGNLVATPVHILLPPFRFVALKGLGESFGWRFIKCCRRRRRWGPPIVRPVWLDKRILH